MEKHFDNFVNAEVIRLDKMDDEVAKIDRLRSYLVDKISTFFKIIEQEKDSQKALTIFLSS